MLSYLLFSAKKKKKDSGKKNNEWSSEERDDIKTLAQSCVSQKILIIGTNSSRHLEIITFSPKLLSWVYAFIWILKIQSFNSVSFDHNLYTNQTNLCKIVMLSTLLVTIFWIIS